MMQALLRAGTCHIVKLHAFYRSQDTAWLVLEYVFLQLHARLIFDPCNSSWSITIFVLHTQHVPFVNRTVPELYQNTFLVHHTGYSLGNHWTRSLVCCTSCQQMIDEQFSPAQQQSYYR